MGFSFENGMPRIPDDVEANCSLRRLQRLGDLALCSLACRRVLANAAATRTALEDEAQFHGTETKRTVGWPDLRHSGGSEVTLRAQAISDDRLARP